MSELRQYEGKEDLDLYVSILREILTLFGRRAIRISLQRTMGKYLKSTGGVFGNAMMAEWELDAVSKLFSHNNAAERLFAIA